MFEFSQLEYSLKHYVAEEIRLDEKYFSAIVESYDMAMLCTVVKTVFRQSRSENTARIIDDLVNEVRELNDERVKVVHGLWVPFKDGGTLHHTSRNKLQSKSVANRAEALERLADEANQLRFRFEQAIWDVEM